MSIAFSVQDNGEDNNNGTTELSYNIVTVSGDDLLVVTIWTRASNVDSVTGVTFNGTSMTRACAQQDSDTSGRYAYIYYLASPDIGDHNVVITCSSQSGNRIRSEAMSFSGSNTSSPLDATAVPQFKSASTSATGTVTVGEDDCLLVGAVPEDNVSSAGTNTTDRSTIPSGSMATVTSTTNVNTGSQSVAYTAVASGSQYGCMASFKSAAAASTFTPSMMMF